MSAPNVTVDVAGIGAFVFRPLAPGDADRIFADARDLKCGAPFAGDYVAVIAGLAAINVLAVSTPPDWRPDDLNLSRPPDLERLAHVMAALANSGCLGSDFLGA
jgi:hypothetical protein